MRRPVRRRPGRSSGPGHDRHPDAAAVRALTEAALPAFGAIGLIATTAFLVAAGCSILATGALARWTGWTGLAAAVLNLAAAPTIYGGGDFLFATIYAGGSAGPYSYATVVAGVAFAAWLAAGGITMIRRGRANLSAALPGQGERRPGPVERDERDRG